jgi:hypothetical protein
MKFRISFGKSGKKNGREEMDTISNNVVEDEQCEPTNAARARPNASDGLGFQIWFEPEPSMEPIAEYVLSVSYSTVTEIQSTCPNI